MSTVQEDVRGAPALHEAFGPTTTTGVSGKEAPCYRPSHETWPGKN